MLSIHKDEWSRSVGTLECSGGERETPPANTHQSNHPSSHPKTSGIIEKHLLCLRFADMLM